MKYRYELFCYSVIDLKAAQAHLNRMGASGWRLDRIWLETVARYVPADRPVSYCVDWCDARFDENDDYLQLCADAGWTFVAKQGYWNLYEAPAGTPPIQTDSALEYERFQKQVWKQMRWGAVLGGAGLLFLAWLLWLTAQEIPMDGNTLLLWMGMAPVGTVFFGLSAVMGLVGLARFFTQLAKWRRAARTGEPVPDPGRGERTAAKVFGSWNAFFWVGWIAILTHCLAKEGFEKVLFYAVVWIAIGLWFRKRPFPTAGQRREAKGCMIAAVWVLLYWLLLFPVARSWETPGPAIPSLLTDDPARVAAQSLGDADTLRYNVQETSGLLLHYTSWDETDGDNQASLSCYRSRWETLTDAAFRSMLRQTPGLTPAEEGGALWEMEEVWRADVVRTVYLLRTENGVAEATLFTVGPVEDALKTDVIRRMEHCLEE